MFGYVLPLKEELKVHQLNTFKSYYCGLCCHIKEDFGQLPRMVLNYDLVAMGMLLDGLSPDQAYLQKKNCIVHPATKKPVIIRNKALQYTASMNVALVYYKLLDDIQDDHNLKSEALAKLLVPYKVKFKPEIRKINRMIAFHLKELYALEQSKNFQSIDEVCHPFSLIVGKILQAYPYSLAQDSPQLREKLFNFGYALGKWIYMIDALDDLEKDMAKGRFNPINHLYNRDHLSYDILINKVRDSISFTLLNCGYNCRTLLDDLPLKRHKAILQNIISLGMMDRYNKILSPCQKCKGGK